MKSVICDDITEKIINIINELKGIFRVGNGLDEKVMAKKISYKNIEDTLSDLGIDSIMLIRIVVELEDAFGIEIGDEYLTIENLNSIKKLRDMIIACLAL